MSVNMGMGLSLFFIYILKIFTRFGHAVVKIGDKVLAVGGSRLRPDVMTDSIETFDKVMPFDLSSNLFKFVYQKQIRILD